MTGQVVERIPADALTLDPQPLGDSGQGRICRVTAIHGKPPTAQLAYKKYQPTWLTAMDAEALRNLVSFQRGLRGASRQLLGERTAWPQAVVEEADGQLVGFLMPLVPNEFLRPLHRPGNGDEEYCQVQHLLNDDAYLRLVRIPVQDSWRLGFLRDVAETIDVLHRLGVTVGDLFPLNIFPSFVSVPRCFFVDCDAMELNGRSVLPQTQIRGWPAPDGQQTATTQSDAYKFALLAVRLFAGNQDTHDTAALSRFSIRLGELAREGLQTDPWSRPYPAQWAWALQAHAAHIVSSSPSKPVPNPSPIPAAPPKQATRWRGWRWLLPTLILLLLAIATPITVQLLSRQSNPNPNPPQPTNPPSQTPQANQILDPEQVWDCPEEDFCVWPEPGGMGKLCHWKSDDEDWQSDQDQVKCEWSSTTKVQSFRNRGTGHFSIVIVYQGEKYGGGLFKCIPPDTAWNMTAGGVILRSHQWTSDPC